MFQRPGSNAIAAADRIISTMQELSQRFPPGLKHEVIYNPTAFVEDSISEVFATLWQAGLLVVETVERLIAEGLSPREATRKAMDEVGGALVATTLVLIAVFVPTAFIAGISGQFYRQFALTIAASTAISTFVSLTFTPALCAMLLRPKQEAEGRFGKLIERVFGWPFRAFNVGFDKASSWYASAVGRVLRRSTIMLMMYVGLIGATYYAFTKVPTGFIPPPTSMVTRYRGSVPDKRSW